MIKSWLTPKNQLAVLLILAAAFYFGIAKINADTGQNGGKFNQKTQTLITPVKKDISDELTLTGFIDAQKAEAKFQSSGLLTYVAVKEGDRVKKGQLLASLDRRELQKNLQKQFNDYKSGLLTFLDVQDKYKSEKDHYLLTDEIKRVIDRSQGTLNNSVIDYELAEIALKYSYLLSPINGIVLHLDQPFANVFITPATATISLVNPDSIYFRSEIDQEDISKIRVGSAAQITFDSFPDTVFDSQVSYISFSPISGQSSTVYEVRFPLATDNQNLNYRLGMDGDAKITLNKSFGAITLPSNAIFEENNQKFVLVKPASSKELTKVPVSTGIETDTDIEITKGLTGNENVVVKK